MDRSSLKPKSSYAGQVAAVAGLLRSAQRLLVITGAGISADSGLPTYRGVGGLYEQDITEDAVPIEIALSGSMLISAPEITWKYIGQIEAACRGAKPNIAHQTLAHMEQHCPQMCVLTQNVDGFHRDAGSRDVIEMHGNIHQLHCTRCSYDTEVRDYSALEQLPPSCPNCMGVLRPRVVLFDEMLPQPALERYYQVLDAGPDLIITVGTTAAFPYIAAPVEMATRAGIATVEINPGISEISALVDYRITQRAAVALPDIYRAM